MRLDFLLTRNVGFALIYVKLYTFLVENISLQFDGMTYQQKLGFVKLLYVLCIFYSYEIDFMSHHKSKRVDLI